MRHTIIADASFDLDTGAGGYAYWVASERGKFGNSGQFKEPTTSNVAAEMMALVVGLYAAIKNGIVQDRDEVLLQTDCFSAIQGFQGTRVVRNEEEKKAVKVLTDYVERFNIHLRFRHVKGHTQGLDARTKTNNLCDERARAEMRKMRHSLKLQKLKEDFLK